VRLVRHEADSVYIDALGRRDYQLLLTAARALEGSPNGARAVSALLDALRRITAEARDTSRDPRLAILARLREFGSREHAPALQTCLVDFDPAVATECAATLQAWTGLPPRPPLVRPRVTAPGAPAPTATRARVIMKGGGTFDLRLFPDDAAATVGRFVRLARQGYYNGLTFHRVVPNFVIQGGSPGANEYMGDGPFMRDEVGLRTHARGTLGISTRGRDTGDAQIFVNLVDNPRLDHNYTVFADVTAGMDVVDGIIEGDVIERIEIPDS
jgi:cyclophilin family peptidyl-prolyl cis-trans isomerase